MENFVCPMEDIDCPYYADGNCHLENPMEDCDDFAYFWDDDIQQILEEGYHIVNDIPMKPLD